MPVTINVRPPMTGNTYQREAGKNARRNAFLSVDGGKALRMNIGDVATVRKANKETKLIRLKDRSFYDVVNSKFKKA